jgi:hypothetical protein
MADKEKPVRDAALALKTAIDEATAAGYRIEWPGNPSGLATIAISETGRVGEAEKPAPGDEYESMTKAALVELATARNIDIHSGATKADVIAALKNQPAS